jgi:hypothetical protein
MGCVYLGTKVEMINCQWIARIILYALARMAQNMPEERVICMVKSSLEHS